METIWDHFMWTEHAVCCRRDKSRKAMLVSELTEEDLAALAKAEVPAEYAYLDEEWALAEEEEKAMGGEYSETYIQSGLIGRYKI